MAIKFGVTMVLSGLAVWLFVVPAEAADRDRKINCDGKRTIGSVIPRLKDGDVLRVSGTCDENVVITESSHNLTLDGQGTATINGANTSATVIIRGTGIIVTGFTITGGSNGIQINRGGTALIRNSTIQNTGGDGIQVNQGSFARIVNSAIQNNPNGSGILVSEGSAARIGFLAGTDTVASPNTIQSNGVASGDNGITVLRASSARIVGNTISNNGNAITQSGSGILVADVSSGDIASNAIEGNAQHGINVGRTSGVRLGRDSGSGIFEAPNSTDPGNPNGAFGIRCFINSSADGRLGTLNGGSGAKDFVAACFDSLIP